jgi:ribosomal protein S18 acetylase RimI-like enzyme
MKIEKRQLDAKTLAEFDLANFDENHQMDEGEWTLMLGTGRVVTYIARDEQEEVAAILVLKAPAVEIGVWYFYSVAVSEKSRRSGIATKLFREAIKAEISFGFINSHCHIDNTASIGFHKSLGFVPVQYVNDFYGDFEDAILWKRAR